MPLAPRACALLLALVFGISIADSLLRIPIQPSDSLEQILESQRSPSAVASFRATISSPGFMRPMFRAQNKALFDLAHGTYYQAVYRGFHALLLVTAVLLFAAATRVQTHRDVSALAFALTVLVGLHTFRGTVQEAFPVNHYLIVLVVCLLTVNLARSKGGLWVDLLAVASLAYATLTLETGVLVWVIAITAWALGWRGISARGVATMTAVLIGYFYLRFVSFDIGTPGMSERSTGYLLEVLDPPELERLFGNEPYWFYGYNVLTSALSVLASEPRAGSFVAMRSWLGGEFPPYMPLAIVTSLTTTILVGWVSIRVVRSHKELDDTGRFVVLFLAVLAGNAALSFAYSKDEILIPAGAFYALAAFAGTRHVLEAAHFVRGRRGVALAIILTMLATGWAVRSAGVHYVLRSHAFKHRNDWAELPGELRRHGNWPKDAAAEQLILRLRDDALATPVPNPRFERRWLKLIWEE